MPIKAQAQGKTFTFPDGTSPEVMGAAIDDFFSKQQPTPEAVPQPAQQQSAQFDLGQALTGAARRFGGALETAGAIGSGIVAEPVAGIAGLAAAANPFAQEGAGARTVEAVRGAITAPFAPETEEGIRTAEAVATTLQPAAEALQQAETGLGDAAFESTGSPAIAALATTAPTAVLEALGVGTARRAAKVRTGLRETPRLKDVGKATGADVDKALIESAPDIDVLKDTSRAIYKELDETNVTMQPSAFKQLTAKISRAAKQANVDDVLTPDSARVRKLILDELKDPTPRSLTQLDNIRKRIGQAAGALKPADARVGAIMLDEFDSFLDDLAASSFSGPRKIEGVDINKRYTAARRLWGRARRAETISDAIDKAGRQASGFENGLRTQLRQILNNKKRSRYFSDDELKAMDEVVKGTTQQNIYKLVGRLGFSEGQATNILGGLAGVATGSLAGPAGAAAIPVVGTIFRRAAQRETLTNTKLADALVRAGSDGKKITQAYLRLTPASKRSALELSDLLLEPNIDLDQMVKSGNKLAREAAEVAKGRKAFLQIQAAGAAAPTVLREQEQ